MYEFENRFDFGASSTLIIPGPTGTLLGQQGLPTSLHELTQLDCGTEALASVHRLYLEAGADFVIAHTFGAQPGRNPQLPQSENEQISSIEQGVRIAATVAADYGVPTAASVSPICDCYEPWSGLQEPYDKIVARQISFIQLLRNSGVDLIIAETFPCIPEAQALATAATIEKMPYGISFYAVRNRRGEICLPDRFGIGLPLFEAVPLLCDGDIKPGFVSINCVPLDVAIDGVSCIAKARKFGTKIGAWPNGNGVPDNTPAQLLPARQQESIETFSRSLIECHLGGAAIVGGCCCTTPEDTAILKSLVGHGL